MYKNRMTRKELLIEQISEEVYLRILCEQYGYDPRRLDEAGLRDYLKGAAVGLGMTLGGMSGQAQAPATAPTVTVSAAKQEVDSLYKEVFNRSNVEFAKALGINPNQLDYSKRIDELYRDLTDIQKGSGQAGTTYTKFDRQISMPHAIIKPIVNILLSDASDLAGDTLNTYSTHERQGRTALLSTVVGQEYDEKSLNDAVNRWRPGTLTLDATKKDTLFTFDHSRLILSLNNRDNWKNLKGPGAWWNPTGKEYNMLPAELKRKLEEIFEIYEQFIRTQGAAMAIDYLWNFVTDFSNRDGIDAGDIIFDYIAKGKPIKSEEGDIPDEFFIGSTYAPNSGFVTFLKDARPEAGESVRNFKAYVQTQVQKGLTEYLKSQQMDGFAKRYVSLLNNGQFTSPTQGSVYILFSPDQLVNDLLNAGFYGTIENGRFKSVNPVKESRYRRGRIF